MDRQYPPIRTKPKVSAFRKLGALITAIRILKLLKSMLAGYKTYILGTLAALTSIGTYLAGMITLPEMLAGLFGALQSMNLRSAITTEAKK